MATDKQKVESGWEAEYDTIRDRLSNKLALLRFPDALEQDVRRYLKQRAIYTLRENYWMLFVCYVLAAGVAFMYFEQSGHFTVSPHDARLALGMFAGIGLCIMLIAFFSRLPQFDDWYMGYVAVPTVLILMILTVAPAFFRDPLIALQTGYYVVFALHILYGVSNMRLLQSAQIGFGSLFLSFVALVLLGATNSLFLLIQFGLLANVVGAGNAYVLEMRDRRLFLQARMLELEKRQLNRLTERMVQLAREDDLTGLANRRHFNDNFLLEWERGRRERYPLSLVFVDIDYFKAYNDNHGHLEGDRALAAVAAELKPLARRAGDLAARYGGEEFVLLLPNTPLAGACDIAEEMLAAVDARRIPHKASAVSDHVTVSIGVATMVPDVHVAPSQLIDLADAALYTAKEGGRHQVVASDFD